MKTTAILTLAVLVSSLLVGCPKKETGSISGQIEAPNKNYEQELPPGQLALRKITDPAEIPDFTPAFANTEGLRQSLKNSIDYMTKPSSKQHFPYGEISHDQALASLQEIARMLDGGMNSSQMNAAVRERFEVYTSVGCDNQGTVLFTGYYTPIFDASPTKTGQFQYPLYRQPEDLAKGPDGKILGRKGPDNSITPYPTREEIEKSGMMAGKEIVYLGNGFEAYICQVQGSARLRMPDGKLVTYGYAANNGQEYKSVGKELIADGKITKESLSLQALIDYFRAHPDEVQKYTWRNPRYVFFAATTDDTPRGCLNVPVTKMRSIATDKDIFPRACLAMLKTDLPQYTSTGVQLAPYSGFALDQDAGGAIRAAGRCDVYMGVGPEAGTLAGRTYREGRLYYIFLKPAMITPPGLPPMGTDAPKPPQP